MWPGLLDDVPGAFRAAVVDEPAFSIEDSTFVIWCEVADGSWRAGSIELANGDDPDGAEDLLELVAAGAPQFYADFALDYYEVEVDLSAVGAVLGWQGAH